MWARETELSIRGPRESATAVLNALSSEAPADLPMDTAASISAPFLAGSEVELRINGANLVTGPNYDKGLKSNPTKSQYAISVRLKLKTQRTDKIPPVVFQLSLSFSWSWACRAHAPHPVCSTVAPHSDDSLPVFQTVARHSPPPSLSARANRGLGAGP